MGAVLESSFVVAENRLSVVGPGLIRSPSKHKQTVDQIKTSFSFQLNME